MKKLTVLMIAAIFGLTTLSLSGGKESKSATKDSKAACCAADKMTASKDAKECTDKDAASCDMSKAKASNMKDCCKDGKTAKTTKASLKSKKSSTATTPTGGTN